MSSNSFIRASKSLAALAGKPVANEPFRPLRRETEPPRELPQVTEAKARDAEARARLRGDPRPEHGPRH